MTLTHGLWGARADNRGLSTQTTEWARHMAPDRVWGVDMTADGHSPYPCDWTPYDGLDLTVTARSDICTGEADARIRRWLGGLDVVVAMETFYTDQIVALARQARTATVCVTNPEMCRWITEPGLDLPDLLVSPTPWRADTMPGGCRTLPFPVARDRCAYTPRPLASEGEPLTFLHVAGHKAAFDRAGTQTVSQALAHVREPCRVLIRSQSPQPHHLSRAGKGVVDVQVVCDNLTDYWELYNGADVMLAPRRYGGQNLPVNEALSCGLPVVAIAREPERQWIPPASLVPGRVRRRFKTQGGTVDIWHASAVGVAQTMDRLSRDRHMVAQLSGAADRHAASMSWEALSDDWWGVLEDAVALRRRTVRV